ncbi:aldehyde dehydrogenase [Novosphingobium sp. MBES04]|nr:aldehyde dehydrogenase [Novosphingobium sp. MBES04]
MTTTATSFIDGAFLPAGDGFELPVFDPTSGQQASALREADAAEVDAAVKAARAAFGPWSALGSEARSNVLQAIDAKLRAHGDELAELEARTSGLPISGVRPLIDRAAENFKRFAEVASMMAGETFQQNEKYLTYTTREAKGVAALIAPWNAPLALGSMRLATCIAFGNTCVLKPSEYTPQSTLRMVELMHEAGLPKGVVNVVNGRGSVTGEALTTHPDIDMIGFTGGTTTGRRIMAAAGERLTPVTMELGGKSAAIVAPDADLERALDGTLLAIYASNGQQCLGGSRILVHESIAEEFIAAFVARAKASASAIRAIRRPRWARSPSRRTARTCSTTWTWRARTAPRSCTAARRPKAVHKAGSWSPSSRARPAMRRGSARRRSSGPSRRSSPIPTSTRRSRWPMPPTSALSPMSGHAIWRRPWPAARASARARSGSTRR